MVFKIICCELVAKDVDPDEALSYTIKRLREIGSDISKLNHVII